VVLKTTTLDPIFSVTGSQGSTYISNCVFGGFSLKKDRLTGPTPRGNKTNTL
jgi:hypothetical protein